MRIGTNVVSMKAIDRAYKKVQKFVDEFANSSTDEVSVPKKIENRTAWYAEWDDNYLGNFLNSPITKAALRKIADKYYGKQIEEIIENATEITQTNYPQLFNVYNYCCDKLGIYNQPKAFVTKRMKGINALSMEVLGESFVLISPRVAVVLSREEQAFLIGHEISHHQQGNLVCHTANGLVDDFSRASEIFGPLFVDAIEVPLKHWCQYSEFNADRGGYICCKDLETIQSLFKKVGMNPNPSSYERYREMETIHPLLYTRFKVLKGYIQKQSQQC